MTPLAATGAAGVPAAPDLTSQPALLFVAIAALSILPFVILLMTSFVKIAVVLAVLRSAFGSAQIPPSQVITGLALILTMVVMAPTGERMLRAAEPAMAHRAGISLLSADGLASLSGAATRAKEPLREFLGRHASPKERAVFHDLSRRLRMDNERAAITDQDFSVLVPAFLATELRRAFEIGFLIFIPFLVVDLIIANLLVALGMNMLSPTAVSLPFKLLLFVLADGWQILMRGLIQSYV